MASLTLFPLVAPATPAASPLPVGPVVPAAAAPAALLAEMETPPLPGTQVQVAQGAPTPADGMPSGAAMRPDQVLIARQLTWPSQDGGTLAIAWRNLVRSYGAQIVSRDVLARPGQLPTAMLLAGQDPRAPHLADQRAVPFDAWRFTVHAGSPRDQHLRVVQQDPGSQPQQRRRRSRAALRLELVLADDTVVAIQAEPVANGVRLELWAPNSATLARLRALQSELEAAVVRAGLRVLAWKYRDNLPPDNMHIRLPSADAALALSLPVFRAMAELALVLPAERRLT